jgi:hypothetical protein
VALQTFTAGQVLTAAQVTALQANDYNQTVNNYTDSRVLTIADLGDRNVMNKATATTITVNTGIFAAGDTLWIHNIGAGVCTITAGTATVSTSGSLALSQNQGGTLYFTSTGVAIFFPTVQASAQGLTLLNTTSFSAVSSISLPASTFTSTYRNYKIILNFSATSGAYLTGRLRAAGADDSTSNYGSAFNYQSLTASNPTGDTNATATQTSFTKIAYHTASNDNSVMIDLFQPQVSAKTFGLGFQMRSDAVFVYAGLLHQGTTSFDSFTFISGAGTITGSVNVYGFNV